MKCNKKFNSLLSKIEECWGMYPDLRLGQLIYTLCYNYEEEKDNTFFIEDKELEEIIIKKIKEAKKYNIED